MISRYTYIRLNTESSGPVCRGTPYTAQIFITKKYLCNTTLNFIIQILIPDKNSRVVCLGYVVNHENPEAYITDDYVVDPSVKYFVDICGKRFPAAACLHSPNLPMTSSEQPTHFRPTQ
uniref:Uncharacterized protein n=1 Tax=Romanomermis culicivorax TaxID=13658 RepID=A0A915KCM4_ROMCU